MESAKNSGTKAFAALLMAGLGGGQNKIEPGEPLNRNVYELPPKEGTRSCLSFDERRRHVRFFKPVDQHEPKKHDAIRSRPHSHEIFLDYDVQREFFSTKRLVYGTLFSPKNLENG
jgi:glutamine synthetase